MYHKITQYFGESGTFKKSFNFVSELGVSELDINHGFDSGDS